MPGRNEESFNIHVPLEMGRSTITLSALDSQEIRPVRNSLLSASHRCSFSSIAQPIEPTPTPVPTRLPTDSRPIITLLSEIPATTSEAAHAPLKGLS